MFLENVKEDEVYRAKLEKFYVKVDQVILLCWINVFLPLFNL
jgi:hypothetical protein